MKKIMIYCFVMLPLIGYSQTKTIFGFTPTLYEYTELSSKEDITNKDLSLFDIRHNAVYNMDILLFCYERTIPLEEKFGLILTGGLLIWEPVNFVFEVGLLMGGPKQFAEMGIGYHINPSDADWSMGIIRGGYRLQLYKGFLAKASIAYATKEIGFIPLLGVGYAF